MSKAGKGRTPAALMPVMRSNLLLLAIEYQRLRDGAVTLNSIGRKFHGDGPFFENLQADTAGFTVRKYDEVVKAFHDGWPDGQAFPELVEPRHRARRK